MLPSESVLFHAGIGKDEIPFLQELQDNSGDSNVMHVYADWLEERGDRRYEFLRALAATDPSDDIGVFKLSELRLGLSAVWLACIGDTEQRLTRIAAALDGYEENELLLMLISEGRHDASAFRAPRQNSCLSFHRNNGLLDIEFCADAGNPNWSGPLSEVFQTAGEQASELGHIIGNSEFAAAVTSIYLWTPVAGNGTAHVDLEPYLQSESEFRNLTRFETNFRNEDGECIIDSDYSYEESGFLAKLLRLSPNLTELIVPSAPNEEFFQQGERPLELLHVKAGFSHQDFIAHLAGSACFPKLRRLVFEDCFMDYMDDWRDHVTPFEPYQQLLQSPAMRDVETITISNACVTDAELNSLLEIRSDGVTISQIPRQFL